MQKNALLNDKRSDFGIGKINYPENTLFYIKQSFLTVQKGKNVLSDIETCEFGPDEVKINGLLYDVETGEFKKLKETIGLICVRGDPDEIFFNYGFET